MKFTGQWEQFRLKQRLANIEREQTEKTKALLDFKEAPDV